MNKKEIEDLYVHNKGYINVIIYMFLKRYPFFTYMRSELKSECNYRFVLATEKFTEGISKFSTFVYDQLWLYMLKVIAKETRYLKKIEKYKNEMEALFEPEEVDYDQFEDILRRSECTDNQKEVLRMRFKLGYTQQEIGEDLDVSQQAIDQTLKRSFERIKKYIGGC